MKKNRNRMMEPGFQLSVVFLALFAVVAALLGQYLLAGAEAVTALVCFYKGGKHTR